uniref:procollagen-proline 4-dioxygenase n=1 Tax=Ananas comosus var. bracteatus TaxID=296719 RepID=A0A6V7QAX8_ANACO|nr:unnamed protein product [Ananas comosus var. bracteatus]
MGLGFRCALAVLSLLFVVSLTLVLREETSGGPVTFDPARVTQVSWKPRVFLYKRFLSDEECDHLIKLAKSKLAKSRVADNESGKSVMSNVRTSSGMFLMKRQDAIVARIEQRIAAWTFLPEENAEPIQVLRYGIGQKYEPHFDYFNDQVNQVRGGHRAATVLMYLSDVEKGGETVFPNAEGWESQPKDDSWSDCARGGYAALTSTARQTHTVCMELPGNRRREMVCTEMDSCEILRQIGDEHQLWQEQKCSDENVMCPQWQLQGSV